MRRSNQVPEPWASAMIASGFVDGRHATPTPSLSALARKVGRHTTTISRIVSGDVGQADPAIVGDVAAALGLPVTTVSGWARQSREVQASWRAPSEVELLTERERRALTDLIRAMAAGRQSSVRPSLSVVDGELSFRAGQDAARRGEAGDEGVDGGPSL